VVDVPSRPAFVRFPGQTETNAQVGQIPRPNTMFRTQKPGRLQVNLADGRAFRLGGDALLRLSARDLTLQRGQIIAWVNPGAKGGAPLRVNTRVGTASIEGTTVFIDATDTQVKVFSWEGHVKVTTTEGQTFSLQSGEQLTYGPPGPSQPAAWLGPRRLTLPELTERRAKSILLNGFAVPMDTLSVIEKELGLKP
jgi:ferric-dicitrate binding protein FerR (iron transport regulator)